MTIVDLSFLDLVLIKNIKGGVSASGTTDVTAEYGFGSAVANTTATGNFSSTQTKTSVKVSVTNTYALTNASATASSIARKDDKSYKAYSDNSAVFLGIKSPE